MPIIFVTVIGFMFSRIQTGFKDSAIQRKEGIEKMGGNFDKAYALYGGLNSELTDLKISQARIQALLEMSLLQKGLTFQEINDQVDKKLREQGIISDEN